MKERFELFLKECPIVAILRGITPGEITDVCAILYEKGIRILEVPLNSADAIKSIKLAAEYCGGRMMVGAGTVLSKEDVRNVKAVGGTFIISPNTDAEVIQETKACGLLSMPGFFTASEGFAAMKAGADYLKLFPAILGTTYVKDLKAVIKAPIFAVGGVKKDNIPDFLSVCAGVGIGSALYKAGKSLEEISIDAEDLVSVCHRRKKMEPL